MNMYDLCKHLTNNLLKSQSIDFLKLAVYNFFLHLRLLVRITHSILEVHLVILAHVRVETEVVRPTDLSLSLTHDASLHHSAHSHV